MTVTVDPTDFHKAKEAIDALIPDVEYDACEITMLPQEYVTLESEEDKESWNRLLTMLDDCDDVQKVYHNVEAGIKKKRCRFVPFSFGPTAGNDSENGASADQRGLSDR